MKRILLAIVAIGTLAAPLAAITSAQAQVPRNGPYGDRDRDGIPNAWDNHDNRRDRYDRYESRALRDNDHDGVPNAWDRRPNNPYVR
jgi:Ni/Co efflux regulator RcnB